ncbi:MAG: YtxH domain-containing protein [Nitrospiraceae bacterium]|nr:YtxH domain-containing protein [Nitrospiraceae bacterium]
MMRNSTSNMVLSFTIGGLLGAGLALIFAPHSGEKTRRKIMDAIDDAKEEISDYAERIKAKLV